MTSSIRRVLADHGRLSIDVDALAPDAMLTRGVFQSIASIEVALTELQAGLSG